ncbi:dnaJ homolog subfamily C member 22 [Exaiptasia diaphana]|uniref:DnaJ homolog subfamily C member 22 n=1 Tax=Exaiptasia diaphana TaxID=2652724 RepID=A0A913YAH2_EXADI|nr:dnaJ homolog subfamily C member 22 [Exaiptasia diaphana]KXJ28293.1 DnaJ-like subfamily C member 22 [Exaiptasia diaphana]
MAERRKSLLITYILWILWGWLGVHHLYLGRDIQAFVWWSTVGGVCGFGWFRDLWRIPAYVEDANLGPDEADVLKKKIKSGKEPPFNVSRFAGQMLVGHFYGILMRVAIPDSLPKLTIGILVPIAVAAGVYLVGNIGRERGDFKYAFMGCISSYAVITFLTSDEPGNMYVALFGAMSFQYKREYKKEIQPTKKTLWKRLQILGLGALIIFALWCSFFYFNAEVTTEDGEKIKLRDAVNHFFNSPVWMEFKDTIKQLYDEGQRNGWDKLYDDFVKALDPRGEQNAYKVLGLTENASQQEIRRRYKKLAVMWHPDKNPDNKELAQKKFMEIQEAYEILSQIKSARASKNSESRSDKDRSEF